MVTIVFKQIIIDCFQTEDFASIIYGNDCFQTEYYM